MLGDCFVTFCISETGLKAIFVFIEILMVSDEPVVIR